jgi:TonB family protein
MAHNLRRKAITILVLLSAASPLLPQSLAPTKSNKERPKRIIIVAPEETPAPDLSADFLKPSESPKQFSALVESFSRKQTGTAIGSGPPRSPFCKNGEDDVCYNSSSPGISPPVAIFAPGPEYPKSGGKLKKEGLEVVFAIVAVDGKVYAPKVRRSIGTDFDTAAIAAIQQWKFKPATRQGKPVAVFVNVEVSFKAYDDSRAPAAQAKP